ncbi:hypothetical protein ACTXT7_012802 [Hymenolepis weldensis]
MMMFNDTIKCTDGEESSHGSDCQPDPLSIPSTYTGNPVANRALIDIICCILESLYFPVQAAGEYVSLITNCRLLVLAVSPILSFYDLVQVPVTPTITATKGKAC